MYWLDIDKFIPIRIENINVINLNFYLYSFTMLVYHSKHLVFFIMAHRNRSRRNTTDTTSSFNNNRENGGRSPGSVASSLCQDLWSSYWYHHAPESLTAGLLKIRRENNYTMLRHVYILLNKCFKINKQNKIYLLDFLYKKNSCRI